MRKTNKIFKKHYILYIVPIILFVSVYIIINTINISNTSALSYQNSTNVQFTFNPTISVNISGNLSIDSLSPGNASDSNIVDVSVATNNVSGYTLTATVGTNTSNTDLTNIADSTYKFSSLTSNIASLIFFNDNTWGYSYSVDNGTNWISGSVGSTLAGYNGLPLDTNTNTDERGKGGITLIDTYNAADSKTIKFKIGALAGSTQTAGTYTNTINYYAITKVPPISISDAFAASNKTQLNGYYKMQDMSPTICNMVQTIDEDSQTQLIDIRDNKIYWVAKLQDGHCWMTQNLDLDLTSGVALTSDTTDLTTYGTTPYIEGYSSNNGIISWTPMDWTSTESTGSVHVSATTRTPNANGNFSDWINGADTEGADQYKDGYIHPLSADPGDWYEKGTYFEAANCNFLTSPTCTNYFTTTPDSVNGTHGHVGNYYNFIATIASSNGYGANSGNQANSICSANWQLPESANYILLNQLYNENRTGDGLTLGDKGLFDSPLYFVRAGSIHGGSLTYPGSLGDYWISYIQINTHARVMNFRPSSVNPNIATRLINGFSVRCLARDASSISDLVYLQDFNSLSSDEKTAVKNSMTTGTGYTLKDKRDNQEYTIAKLEDGNVWMIDNLNLGDADNYPLVTSKLDYTNTNLPNDSTKEIAATTFNNWKVSRGSASYTTPEYISLNTSNTSNHLDTDPTSGTKYGTLYNYCATSANTYCYEEGQGTGNATADLCPAGWRLPTDGSNGEFYNLAATYGYSSENISNTNLRKPLAEGGAGLGLAGVFNANLPAHQGGEGYYWSSTRGTGYYMYRLFLGVSNVYPVTGDGRYYGFSIRCIMK